MHEHGLARDLWPQLEQIATTKGFATVTRVEMVVGMLHGVTGEFLSHSFEHVFEGTSFAGAAVAIRVVDPGEEFAPPNQDEPVTANGWELFVTGMEGTT